MHKQITTSFQHRLHKKNYHSWIFENFIKVSPKPNYTYLFYFQTNINNIRSSYIFCVDFTHKLGLQIAGACTMFMKHKNEKWRTIWFSAKCTKFISRILNKWPVGIRQWIYIFLCLLYLTYSYCWFWHVKIFALFKAASKNDPRYSYAPSGLYAGFI